MDRVPRESRLSACAVDLRQAGGKLPAPMSPALILVALLLGSGYLARRLGTFPEEASDAFNRFVIYLCVPAVILRVVPDLTLRWELVTLVVVPWTLAAVAFALVRGLRHLLRFDRQTETALFVCTALGNTSFLGFPLCSALLGPDSLPLAAVYDQMGSFLLLCGLLPLVLARASGATAPSLVVLVRRVLSFPPFIALVVALLPLPRPAWFLSVLSDIGACLVPTAMFAVGLRLRVTPPKQKAAFVSGLGIKLAIMPLCAYLLAHLLGAPPRILQVAVVESAMPAMISAGAMVMAAGLAVELTAALVGWGIVLAILVVPLWARFVS